MRWYIIRVLLHKEILRHLANRGGLALAGLLVVMAMLLSFFGQKNNNPGSGFVGGVQVCIVDYWHGDGWVNFLKQHVPEPMRNQIRFRSLANYQGIIRYPNNTGGIQIRPESSLSDGTPHYKIWFWYPGTDSSVMAPYEDWFWRESRRYFQQKAVAALNRMEPDGGATLATGPILDPAKPTWVRPESHQFFQSQVAGALEKISPDRRQPIVIPDLTTDSNQLEGTPDTQSTIATALVLFALFFVCVYLLPSLTCEEHEGGVLLAQALSPASPQEILAAKFLFYPVVGMGLAALLAGIYDPRALGRIFFWLALGVAAFGSLGIGMTIASLARTQRGASMGALCYMLVVTMLIFICQQNRIPLIPYLLLEYYCPRMLQAGLADNVTRFHWGNLAGAFAVSCVWAVLAARFFRQRGWQ